MLLNCKHYELLSNTLKMKHVQPTPTLDQGWDCWVAKDEQREKESEWEREKMSK